MSPGEAWREETAKLMEHIDLLSDSVNAFRVDVKRDIAELRSDMRVHKVKTGFVASFTAAVTFIAAWVLTWVKGN